MKKRLLVTSAGFAAAALGFAALLYVFGAIFRPDVSTPPTPPPTAEVAAIEAARKNAQQLDLAHPPVVVQSVDYSEGPRGRWWPRKEAPVLAELVHEGKLPPVAERVGAEPVVMKGPDGLGAYGGTWLRFVNSIQDFATIYWRLSGANLVRWSPQGYPIVPHVAKSWEVSPDGRVYTFTLRRGMKWSDGVPLTSDDIVYWYQNEILYFHVQPRYLLRAGGTLGRVEKIDELRVRFVFDQPNPLFLERLASTSGNHEDYTDLIVPAHYLRQYHPALGDQALIQRTMEALHLSSPVAVYKKMKHYLNPEHPRLWPWVLHTYEPTTPQTFVRNPYYFAVDPAGRQLPYLDRLVLEVKSNSLIAVAAANGEPAMQDRHIRYEDQVLLVSSAARNGYAIYHWKPATQSLFTVFPNLNRRIDPARPETRWKNELLNEARFRQALSLAINRRDIITAEFNGQTEPAQTAPPPDSPYYNARLLHAFTDFEPARANALLDALRLTGRDSEGYRTFPDGTRMTFFLNYTDYTDDGPVQFVVGDWARVGVRVLPRARARKLFEQEKLVFEHDFTVWTGESEFYPLVEPRNFVPTYIESFFAPGFGTWYQYGGLHGDPAAQRPNAIAPPPDHPLRRAMEILDRIDTEPSEATRIALFNQIEEIAADQVWTISLSTPPPQLVVVKDGFRNVPRTAMFGAHVMSPANTGMETYFWSHPEESAAVQAQTKREIVTITPPPGAVEATPEGETFAAPVESPAFFPRGMAVLGLLIAVGWLAVRHPFIGRRLLWMIPTLLIVSVMAFTIVQLPPGDFVAMRIARLEIQGTADNAELAADLRRQFHLDESPAKRYARWLGLRWFMTFRAEDAGLLQGQLGQSMEHEKSVNDVVGDRLVLTVVVSAATVLCAWAFAVPAGLFAAVRPRSASDYGLALLAFLGVSVPPFLLALVLMYLAKRWLGLGIGGLFSPEYVSMPGWTWGKFGDLAKHLWLPVGVLGLGSAAGLMRVVRANVLDELKQPYVITARAKGVRPLRLLLKYPLRLALNPLVSGLGALFPQLVSGGAIVAMVLSLPMLGPVLLDALLAEDVYLAGSMLMLLTMLGVVGTLISDLLLLWLDPRIRMDARSK